MPAEVTHRTSYIPIWRIRGKSHTTEVSLISLDSLDSSMVPALRAPVTHVSQVSQVRQVSRLLLRLKPSGYVFPYRRLYQGRSNDTPH